MKIDLNFLFQSLNGSPSEQEKTHATVTTIGLVAIGLTILVIAGIHLADRLLQGGIPAQTHRTHDAAFPALSRQSASSHPIHDPMIFPRARTGVDREALKLKQKNHLAKLQALAKSGDWRSLQEHTSHPDSGFDWWMFPIDRGSASFGAQYQLTKEDIEALKRDPQFMQSYRKGVILIAKSWGWDLENQRDVTNTNQHWTNYQVRLGKMIHSLKLFNQRDLLENLVHFIDQKKIRPTLEGWIQKML
jgi:hypothetical protein